MEVSLQNSPLWPWWATEKTKKKNHVCFRTKLKTKSLFTITSNVLPFKFKHWQQKICRVKLISWNIVNLSHLQSQSYAKPLFPPDNWINTIRYVFYIKDTGLTVKIKQLTAYIFKCFFFVSVRGNDKIIFINADFT